MTLQERFQFAFREKMRRGLQAEIARVCGVSAPTVSAWFHNPEKVSTVERSQAEKLCAHFTLDVQPAWLAEGVGAASVPDKDESLGSYPFSDMNLRDVYVAGKGHGDTMPEQIWTEDYRPANTTGEFARVWTDDERAFLVSVSGISMAPRFKPGEFALVEPSITAEIEDDVLVRLVTGVTMIRRLISHRGGWTFGCYADAAIEFYEEREVSWVYYVSNSVPRRKIKAVQTLHVLELSNNR